MSAHETRLTRTAVDTLIDEHLMAQQALTDGLDDDPGVVREPCKTRARHILAEALASRLQDRGKSALRRGRSKTITAIIPRFSAKRRLYSLAIFRIDGGP